MTSAGLVAYTRDNNMTRLFPIPGATRTRPARRAGGLVTAPGDLAEGTVRKAAPALPLSAKIAFPSDAEGGQA